MRNKQNNQKNIGTINFFRNNFNRNKFFRINKLILFILFILVISLSGCFGKDDSEGNVMTTLDDNAGIFDDENNTDLNGNNSLEKDCSIQSPENVDYSFDTIEIIEVEKNRTAYKQLNYMVLDYEKKFSNSNGINDYVFFENSDFVEFLNDLEIVGIYDNTDVLEYINADSNTSFRIENTDNLPGAFMVERFFPGKDVYYFKNSSNIKSVYIKPGEVMEVKFDIGVMCYKIDDYRESIELMDYFIRQSEKINDKNDLVVNHNNEIIYTCERAHYKIFPPKVETFQKYKVEEPVIINQQGKDTLEHFEIC